MASHKRPYERQRPHQRQPKRQRIENHNSAAASRPSKEASHGRHTVPLDGLQWKEVPMPDRLEDVEGFFGLEEIENIDVVKNAENGTVEYRLAGVGKAARDSIAINNVAVPEENESDWEGFEDSPSRPIVDTPESITNENLQGVTKDRKGKKNKKEKKTKTAPSVKKHGNAFSGLEDEMLDEDTDVSAWNSLDLSSTTLSAIAKLGFKSPTPIQSASISQILAGHDVIGKASTGSGKTLAFGIPILEHFLEVRWQGQKSTRKSERKAPSALIISPTRELAHQLSTHLTSLCTNISGDSPSIATVTGGLSVQKQQRILATADIVIGTPGRLWEIIRGGHGLVHWLRRVKFLVVDEADRLLSEGHFKEFEEILNVLDREEEQASSDGDGETTTQGKVDRQTLVFSATFHKGLQQRLSGKGRPGGDLMNQKDAMEYLLRKLRFREDRPKFVDVNPVMQMAEGLKEGIVECAAMEKDLYLYALLMYHPHARTLIFTNSISAVRRLTPFLQSLGMPAHALHSQMPQKARLRSVERFSSASAAHSVLVATDVAARGLDIPGVRLVLHYHLPRTADMYVHRSGRTARATATGSSILLCAPDEVAGLRRLVAKVHAAGGSGGGSSGGNRLAMRSVDVDRRVAARLRPRVVLAKTIADAGLAREKHGHEDAWLRAAAADLGVDYSSDDFAGAAGSQKGRGGGRLKAAREARGRSRAELAELRRQLKALLGQRVNVGVSERYLTAGGLDVDRLLRERAGGEEGGGFLGEPGEDVGLSTL